MEPSPDFDGVDLRRCQRRGRGFGRGSLGYVLYVMERVGEGICVAAGGGISGSAGSEGGCGAAAGGEEGGRRSLRDGVIQVLAQGMWRDVCGKTAIGLRRTQCRGSRETGCALGLPGRIGWIEWPVRVVSGGLDVCWGAWRRLGRTGRHGAERGHARQPVRTRLGSDADGVDSLSSRSRSHHSCIIARC